MGDGIPISLVQATVYIGDKNRFMKELRRVRVGKGKKPSLCVPAPELRASEGFAARRLVLVKRFNVGRIC